MIEFERFVCPGFLRKMRRLHGQVRFEWHDFIWERFADWDEFMESEIFFPRYPASSALLQTMPLAAPQWTDQIPR